MYCCRQNFVFRPPHFQQINTRSVAFIFRWSLPICRSAVRYATPPPSGCPFPWSLGVLLPTACCFLPFVVVSHELPLHYQSYSPSTFPFHLIAGATRINLGTGFFYNFPQGSSKQSSSNVDLLCLLKCKVAGFHSGFQVLSFKRAGYVTSNQSGVQLLPQSTC